MPNITWINSHLFPWFDSSNATHTIILGAIGSILASIITATIAWMVLTTWGHAKRVIVDEDRKTHRYLKSLERRARLSFYWKSASFAQRTQFIVLRVVLTLCTTATALTCQVILTFGSIISAMQEDAPRNVVELINVSKRIEGIDVALILQQYVMPATWLLCILAITIIFSALSMIIYVLETVRLAELENDEKLLQAINSIRVSLDLPEVSKETEILRVSHSLLYPQ